MLPDRLAGRLNRIWAIVLLTVAPLQQACAAGDDVGDPATLTKAERALCSSRIVVLGEAGHRDGVTADFKAALTERLIRNCGFTALIWEAGAYEFNEIADLKARGLPIAPQRIAAAAGAYWSGNAGMQDLFNLLAERTARGRMAITGMDDQPFGRGQDYVTQRLPTDLAARLPADRSRSCEAAMVKGLRYQARPEDLADARACLREVRAAAPAASTAANSAANLERFFSRAALTGPAMMADRDGSMFANFQQALRLCGKSCKAIVWTHNAHAARDSAPFSNFAGAANFGMLMNRVYSTRATIVGVAVAGGEREWGRTERRTIAPAADDSLEGAVLAGTQTELAFVPRGHLRALGRRQANVWDYHDAITADWARLFDAMLVVRQEHPPQPRQ